MVFLIPVGMSLYFVFSTIPSALLTIWVCSKGIEINPMICGFIFLILIMCWPILLTGWMTYVLMKMLTNILGEKFAPYLKFEKAFN